MKKRRKKKTLKKQYKAFLFFLIFFVVFYFVVTNKKTVEKIYNSLQTHIKSLRKDIYTKAYNECLSKPLDEEDFSENTNKIKDDIYNYSKNNGLRYHYEDLKTSYIISYKDDEAVYGASLIKLVTAIYLIDNDVDLDTKVLYQEKHRTGSSDGMKNHSVGEKVPIKDLMQYSISVSDNTAHHMLIDYIGKDKLKEYARSLGATAIFTGTGDDYGNQTVHDTTIYLKKAYELINTKENGKLLKEAMLNTRKNALNVADKVIYAHKYGSYNEYYHDIGIKFEVHPYVVSVLTTKGETTGAKMINHLSTLSKDFSDSYYSDLDTYCKDFASKKISKN